MPLTLKVAVPEDLPALIPEQYASFRTTDILHSLIYPSPDPATAEVIERSIARQEKLWSTPNLTWIKVVDDETGEVAAAAKWLFFPEPDEKRWEASVKAEWIVEEDRGKGYEGPGVEDREYVEWVLEQLWDRRRARARGAVALLDLCYTSPKHFRKGAGKMLVQWGTKRADELGIRCVVEASALGRNLYASCGFKVWEDVKLEGGKAKDEWKSYGVIEYGWMERELQPK